MNNDLLNILFKKRMLINDLLEEIKQYLNDIDAIIEDLKKGN
jgi:hypothetical protein